jgi:radical SAM superfamily enzyme YgiQ (UPF0313 family)
MKITFILPCVGRKPGEPYVRSWLMEPLAIGVLSALTPPRHERVFYDDRLDEVTYDVPTDLAAINVETYTARRAYQIAAEYRRRGVPVVMGGFHATLVPDEVARHADAVVVGEAENVWPQLLADLESGGLRKRYQSAERPSLAGIMPDRTLYANKPYIDLALVETARGCRYACEFCSISSFYRKTYEARPIADVVADIQSLNRRHVFFVDDNICVDRNRTRDLLEALIPLRIRWIGQVSLDVTEDDELLDLMRRSGCIGVLIGFESLNPESLKTMGKKVNREMGDYARALRKLRKHGLAVYATFVFGYDGDTEASFEQTLEFALHHRFFFMAFNHLVPFPGTPLYDRLARDNRLRHDAWWLSEDYRFGDVAFHPARFSPEELTTACYNFRKRFYALSSVLKRGLDFQSNCRTLPMAAVFFYQNLAGGRDVRRRQGLPLGLPEAAS